MYARFAVGRGRPLEKYKRGTSLALRESTVEHLLCAPFPEHFAVDAGQIEPVVFFELIGHRFQSVYIIVSGARRHHPENFCKSSDFFTLIPIYSKEMNET